MRACVYTRISDDQTGERLGVQRQLDDCLQLAERLGWEVVARYDDNDISAYNGKHRPGFEQMLDDMNAGQFDALICWHTDRLYRSMKDLERLIEMADERRVQLKTVQGGDLDLATSAGRMLGRILGATARQESEHKAERQKRANQQRRAAGKWVRTGLRKFAYTKDGQPYEPEAAALQKAARDVLAGRSLRGIAIDWAARELTTTRGNPFTSMQLRRTLINPLYAGLVTHHEKVVGRGEWQPILGEDTHRGLVAYLSDPTRRPAVSFERRHMGSGVYRCGICDRPMYAVYPGGKRRAMTYACRPTNHVTRLGAPLDDYVELVVLKHLNGSDIHMLLQDGRKVDVGELHTRRAGLQARLDELAAMFAAGEIDGSQLKRGTGDLRSQFAVIDAQLAELARRSPVADLLAAGGDLEKHWAALSPDMRGKIVSELMTVTVRPTARGVKGVTIDRETGLRIINPDYVDIKPRKAR
jgi:site-specific DNA recombinase